MLPRLYVDRLVLLTFALFLFAVTGAHGQSVERESCFVLEVRSAESNEVLPGATVELPERDRGAAADVEGRAHLCGRFADTLRIRVSSLGYESIDLRVAVSDLSDGTFTVELEPLDQEGGTVIVYGHTEEAGSSAAVLSGTELQEALGATLAETLRGVGGVAVRSLGPAASQPVVRGMSGDRIEVTENGVGTADAAGLSADHATSLDPIGVRSISVVRGPAAFLYSPTPLGGAIDVERRGPDGDGLISGGLTSSYSSVSGEGAVGGGITLRPVKRVDLELEGSYRSAGDVATAVLTIPNSAIETTLLGAALAWHPDSVTLRGRASRYSSEYGVPFDGTAAHPEGVRIEMEKETVVGELEWRPKNRMIGHAQLTGRLTRYQHREIEGAGVVGTEYGIVTTSVDGSLDHAIFGRRGPSGRAGLGFEHVDFVANGVQIDPSNRTTLYGVVHEHLELEELELAASLRLDHVDVTTSPIGDRGVIERSFTGLSGGLGAEYHLTERLAVATHLLRSFRVPSINELLSRGPHAANYAYEIGNDRLDPEAGLGAELAVEFEAKRAGTELRLYLYDFAAYLLSEPTGDTNRASGLAVYRFENREALLRGFEWQGEVRPVDHLTIALEASGTWGEDGRGVPLREIPPVRLAGEARWEKNPWSAAIGLDGFLAQENVGPFESPTDPGATLNLHLRRSLTIGRTIHSLLLTVDNLFDAEIYDHLSRTKDLYPVAGRNVGVGWRIVW